MKVMKSVFCGAGVERRISLVFGEFSIRGMFAVDLVSNSSKYVKSWCCCCRSSSEPGLIQGFRSTSRNDESLQSHEI
jgi:hypothetical protein